MVAKVDTVAREVTVARVDTAAAKEAMEARAATAAVKEATVARAAVDTEADTEAKSPMAVAREADMAASLASAPTTRAPAVAQPAHPAVMDRAVAALLLTVAEAKVAMEAPPMAATARAVDTSQEADINPDVR